MTLWRRSLSTAIALAFFCGLVGTSSGLGAEFSKSKHIRILKSGLEKSKLESLDELDKLGDKPEVLEVLVEVLGRARSATARESRVRMMKMLSKFPDKPEVVAVLRKYLASRNSQLVIVAVDSLGELQAIDALPDLIKLNQHALYESNYGFRKSVIEAVMKINDHKSVVFLIKELGQLDGQLEYDVVRYLHHISYQQFVTNVEHWKTWWRDNLADFDFTENSEPFSLSGKPPEDFTWSQERAEFFGIYIHAKRVVFVLDASDSMGAMVGELSRFEMARRELINAVQKLPASSSFGIVTFNAHVGSWGKKLHEATPENKGKAVEWIRGRRMGDGTASFDALEAGMDLDGNAEAIFFLSDGKPSHGRIKDPKEIVTTITKANFFRRIAFYTIGIGIAGAPTEQMMRDLAAKNSGAYEAVNQ